MLGHTHALFGFTTLAAVQAAGIAVVGRGIIEPRPTLGGIPIGLGLCGAAAILGALLPDLDAEDSTIQRELGGLGILVQLLGVKHRGVLHSGLAAAAVTLLAAAAGWWFGYPDVGLAFGLGYLSHVAIADAMTVSGVPLWWPLKKRFHLLPRPLRVRTGGPVEKLVFIVAAGALLLWLLPEILPPDLMNFLTRWAA